MKTGGIYGARVKWKLTAAVICRLGGFNFEIHDDRVRFALAAAACRSVRSARHGLWCSCMDGSRKCDRVGLKGGPVCVHSGKAAPGAGNRRVGYKTSPYCLLTNAIRASTLFTPVPGICLTNVSLLCYNSITEQGQMFWVVRTLSSNA